MSSPVDLTEHITALRRYARALTGDAQEADDLVQDCLARALTRMSLFNGVTNVRSYLFTILHNIHIDTVKSRARRGTSVQLDVADPHLYQAPRQDESVAVRELRQALRRIPKEQRDVVLLVGLEGMSYKEAADILDVPIGTVMSRLSRGREALRQCLETPVKDRLRVVK